MERTAGGTNMIHAPAAEGMVHEYREVSGLTTDPELSNTSAACEKSSKAKLKATSQHGPVPVFAPSWFTITMGTGLVAITIGNFPYAFSGGLHGMRVSANADYL